MTDKTTAVDDARTPPATWRIPKEMMQGNAETFTEHQYRITYRLERAEDQLSEQRTTIERLEQENGQLRDEVAMYRHLTPNTRRMP